MTRKEMLNNETAAKLDRMELSREAREVIDSTEFNIYHELFGNLDTAEEVEAYVREYYKKDGDIVEL